MKHFDSVAWLEEVDRNTFPVEGEEKSGSSVSGAGSTPQHLVSV